MISVIRVFYKDTPVMFKKEASYPKHIAYMDQAEGLQNSPILWSVFYIIQIPSMEELTRMMGNVTSVVCGRASPAGIEQGPKGKIQKTPSKSVKAMFSVKVHDTAHLRREIETPKAFTKHGP